MIKAVFHHTDTDRISGFEITGHADSGPYGMDIVCAAVSVLSISTVNGLSSVAAIDPQVESDEANGGLLKVGIPKASDDQQQLVVDALLQSFENGLKDVAANYHSFIEIKIEKKK
ncbi:hypothetical protein LOSG293_010430 [Secundilactobacillus oryzae JCM 18671]|uniref:Ribosomal processing cysteine protease Prp n=2 Tax=Secundilactobacillus oryzae TaxID=1202668 RepID=A0A081BFX7_9LACO|nr:ribosomal-processing cysteine protease Prp [Secundilactobacillus oryzae]GAK46945.1 hypothetical protein LOSG293_010430 [Secundilactobacillus oryzae JCM 18671]